MITGHGGNIYELACQLGCDTADIIDMSSNVNPLGPMPDLVDHLKTHMAAIAALPQVDAAGIVEAFAHQHDIDPEQVLAGNGTTQFIFTLPLALGIKSALIVAPTYADYQDACRMHQVDAHFFILNKENGFHINISRLQKAAKNTDLVFVCNPNNPTGRLIPAEALSALCRAVPDTLFVVDESYLPFVRQSKKESLIASGPDNVILLNSMSKIFRIPGLRIGFIKAARSIIEKIRPYMMPWSVNALAQQSVHYLMTEKEKVRAFVEKTIDLLENEKQRFINYIHEHSDLLCYASSTSFILVKLPVPLTSKTVCETLSKDKILIRNCDNFTGLTHRFIRVSLKTETVNTLLAEKLVAICNDAELKGEHNGV